MANWNDPRTTALDYLAVVKVAHFIFGVYLWDWATSLPSEYHLIVRKHARESWLAIYVYIGCRFFAFATVITSMVVFNVTTPINCDAVTRILRIFPYISFILASVILGIRTIAIWRRHKVATVVTVALLLTSVAFHFRGIVVGPRLYWDSTKQMCTQLDVATIKPVVASSFAVNFALIIMMLVGLWVYKGSSSLWQLIYHQGIIWAIVAVICYIPLIVLVALNLNEPLNLVTETPTAISMILCATTMQRRLFQYSLTTANPQLLPHTVMRRSVKFDGRPVPAPNGSPTDSNITIPKPAFIAMGDVQRPVLHIRDPDDDSKVEYCSTIV